MLVTENLIVAIAGNALGLAVGYAGMMLFSQIRIPSDLPIMIAFDIDRRALLFSLAVAVASALVFGLVPAIQASRTDLTGIIKGGDAVGRGRRRRWGRAILATAQVAASVVAARRCHVHVPRLRPAAGERSWLPDRPSSDDGLRHQLDPLTSSSPNRRPISSTCRTGRTRRGECSWSRSRPGDPAALAAPLREVVRGLDVDMPIFNVRTMDELYQMRATSIFNVLVTTVGAMGLMGLGLSIVGLYGLVAYAASRRTREIGIRMAIGATAPNVLRMVLRQGVALALSGLVLGLAASVAAGGLLSAVFPTGDDRRDFVSLALVAPVVFVVTLLATYIPARRAARVNPVEALRYE
jgi:FtsX-like permease family